MSSWRLFNESEIWNFNIGGDGNNVGWIERMNANVDFN